MIDERTPDRIEAMTQQCVRLTFLLCKTTTCVLTDQHHETHIRHYLSLISLHDSSKIHSRISFFLSSTSCQHEGIAAFGDAPSAAIPAAILIATIGAIAAYNFSLLGNEAREAYRYSRVLIFETICIHYDLHTCTLLPPRASVCDDRRYFVSQCVGIVRG